MKDRDFIGLTITWPIQNIYYMSLNIVSILRNLIFSEAHDILFKKVMKKKVVKNQPILEIYKLGAIKSQKLIIYGHYSFGTS